MRTFASLLVMTALACAPAIRRPESSQLVLTGTLFTGGFAQRGEPLTDAKLTLRNAATGAELTSNTSSSAGGYRLTATVEGGTRVVLIVEKDGFAPFVKALGAGPYTEVSQSLSLQPLADFECVDTSCTAARAELEWLEPPMSASGAVTTFDLELEEPLQLDAPSGTPIALGFARLDGGTGGTLALRVPLTRWSALADAQPGTSGIEVAAASFNPSTGAWTTLPAAPLFSESGIALPESALPALQRAEFSGGAVARFPVTNGFVAVLGTKPAPGCLTGVVNVEGKAAQGATLSSVGAEPSATDAAGAFCIAAPTGSEPHQVRTQYAGLPYAVLALPRPTESGRCGGACRDIGSITLTGDSLRTPRLCRFTGRVIDTQGAPVANAEVVAIDDSVLGNNVTAFCGTSGTRCSFAAPSKEDGTFTLNVPLLNSVLVAARVDAMTATGDVQRRGGLRFSECPAEQVTLRLQRGVDRLDVSATFSGDVVTWNPPRAAARLTVLDMLGLEKWSSAPPEGITPPVTIGVPSAAGDSVLIELDGVGRDGVQYLGTGSATRP